MLHFGSLVAAVGSWLCARHSGGQWLVRIDDVDPPRVVPGAASGILATLAAFGLDADGPVLFQSRRGKAYGVAFERLRASGALFPCWCSRGDLIAAGSIHRDGRCITGKDPARAPAWRLRAPDREVRFHDALQGHQKQNLRERTGDFVVRRADGI